MLELGEPGSRRHVPGSGHSRAKARFPAEAWSGRMWSRNQQNTKSVAQGCLDSVRDALHCLGDMDRLLCLSGCLESLEHSLCSRLESGWWGCIPLQVCCAWCCAALRGPAFHLGLAISLHKRKFYCQGVPG